MTFATRVEGRVEHRRRGTSTEKVVVDTAFGEYVLELASDRRSGVIDEVFMRSKTEPAS